MTTGNYSDEYDRAAAGLDFDEPFRERASSWGQTLASHGPEAIFEEIDKMIPEAAREHISKFPITALALAFGAGLLLGFKKSEEVLAAGSAFVGAAASANLSNAFGGGKS